MALKKKKDPDRVTLCTLAGRIVAYLRVNKPADAKIWARAMMFELVKMGLLDAKRTSANELTLVLGDEEKPSKKNST